MVKSGKGVSMATEGNQSGAVNRFSTLPLHEAGQIHAILVSLAIGDVVPPTIYIRDYANGVIPQWIVREREEHGILTVLTVVDESILERHVGMEVFCCPEKVLGGKLYQYYLGCVKARNMLGDIRQHARQIADRMKAGYPPYASIARYNRDLAKLDQWNGISS